MNHDTYISEDTKISDIKKIVIFGDDDDLNRASLRGMIDVGKASRNAYITYGACKRAIGKFDNVKIDIECKNITEEAVISELYDLLRKDDIPDYMKVCYLSSLCGLEITATAYKTTIKYRVYCKRELSKLEVLKSIADLIQFEYIADYSESYDSYVLVNETKLVEISDVGSKLDTINSVANALRSAAEL